MTFESFETGTGARPLELYRFERKEKCWLYTSADEPIVFQSLPYSAVTISRGAFSRDDEEASAQVRVQLDRTLKVCTQFIDGSTPSPVSLTIYRKHRNDSNFIVVFKGVVANATLRGEEVTLVAQSPLGSDEKSIPRHIIMRTCPHVLYASRCALNPEDWEEAGAIVSVTANIVVVSGIANLGNDYFTAGVLYHEDSDYRAFVQDHRYTASNNEFTLLQPPPSDWGASDPMLAYAGCDRKHTTCRDKFNNIPHFGGFPLHPERNPFLDLQPEINKKGSG